MSSPCLTALLRRLPLAIVAAAFVLALPGAARAQRTLYWERLDVDAHLDAAGQLVITETHAMVFTGDWNGGERRFRLRGRQTLRLLGISRADAGGWTALTEDAALDDVNDYAWTGAQTLRWRSRRRTDPLFEQTPLRYQLRYVLAGALQADGDGYRINHDFAFPDRAGVIERFSLRLTFDRAWQPRRTVPADYAVSGLAPGLGFVLDIPLAYNGASPPILTPARPPEIRIAVATLLGLTLLAVLWLFVREQRVGRFAPLATPVNEAWLREHILCYPAEVVGAAWDDTIGKPEVVALLARLEAEGKLESVVTGDTRQSASMTLRLKVDRSAFVGYERTLIARLFFDGDETSTERVQANYAGEGFNPVAEIRDELQARVDDILPPDEPSVAFRPTSVVLFGLGLVLPLFATPIGFGGYEGLLWWGVAGLVVAAIGQAAGVLFRAYIHWGRLAALVCLVPALAIAAGAASYLWFFAVDGTSSPSLIGLVSIVAIAFALTNASINALKSRRSRAVIAVRKTLAAGRAYFASELRQERPQLRDEWYPWMLALELQHEVDRWSRRPERDRNRWRRDDEPAFSRDGSTKEGPPQWTGFGGGRSGGAGGGASWTLAAGSIASGVSVPASSSDSDSGSSWSSDSGSSSSGGGGGGGW